MKTGVGLYCYRRLYQRRIRNMDVRIRLIQMRENPPTIKANTVCTENHPNRVSMIKDLNRTEEFNPFSEESKELITDIGNTGILELYETSCEIQCPDSAFYWEAGIVCCTGGTCMHPTERHRQMNKERFDVLSIPGSVIKKIPSHGARHGPSVRQTMYFRAHYMLRKARSNKNGNCKPILERWTEKWRFTRHCSTQFAFIVWWRNGTTVKNSSQNPKKRQFSRTKWKLRGIARSGVQQRAKLRSMKYGRSR